MKLLRSLVLPLLLLAFFAWHVTKVVAAVTFATAYNLLAASPFGAAPVSVGVTLSTTEILLDVIGAFKKAIPGIDRMGTDFSTKSFKLNKQYDAHIPSLPTISTYDATTGYAYGANSARGLLTDIPVIVDRHKHVPLKFEHLNLIKDDKIKYEQCIANAGYVLGKAVIDDLLSKVTSRNYSRASTFAAVDCDADMLIDVNGNMNLVGALGGRTMLINTLGANALSGDARITSKDYLGQLPGGAALRRFLNTHGFAEIIEYPDMPANDGTATACTATAATDLVNLNAHGFKLGDRVKFAGLTGGAGITAGTLYFVHTPTTNTFKIATTAALAAAGTAVDITTDMSAGTVQLIENLAAFGFDPRAFALLAGVPDLGGQDGLIEGLGIPRVMAFDTVTDPESKITMMGVKWQEPGTGNLFYSPALVWGSVAGREDVVTPTAATAAAGTRTDYAGHRVVTA